jgi:hypothetical protein
MTGTRASFAGAHQGAPDRSQRMDTVQWNVIDGSDFTSALPRSRHHQ